MKRVRIFMFCGFVLLVTFLHAMFLEMVRTDSSYNVRFFEPESDASGRYGIVYNAVTSDEPHLKQDVSIVTQMDATRLKSAINLADSWEGPIQLAVYISSIELWTFTMDVIEEMRRCKKNVRRYVTWHILYAKSACFKTLDYIPCRSYHDNDHYYNYLTATDKDSKGKSRRANQCPLLQDQLELLSKKMLELTEENSSSRHISYYPQTVVMNVALKSCMSDFVLAIDSDLTPSDGLRKQFLRFAHKRNLFGATKQRNKYAKVGKGLVITETKTYRLYVAKSTFVKHTPGQAICERHIDNQSPSPDLYVIPTFETKLGFTPRSIDQLKKEFYSENAQCFYCRFCYPAYAPTDHPIWIQMSDSDLENEDGSYTIPNTSCIYEIKYQHSYEPFFITRRDIPPFDERFLGHTQVDSHHVALLAAMGYRFKVLKNAFLIHNGWKLPKDWTSQQWKESSEHPKFWLNYLEDLDVRYQGKEKAESPPEIY